VELVERRIVRRIRGRKYRLMNKGLNQVVKEMKNRRKEEKTWKILRSRKKLIWRVLRLI
jgi:hypothetical protein